MPESFPFFFFFLNGIILSKLLAPAYKPYLFHSPHALVVAVVLMLHHGEAVLARGASGTHLLKRA